MCFIKNTKTAPKLSDDAINFIKIYAIPHLNITNTINEETLAEIVALASEWESSMVDEFGYDKDYDYPDKERNEKADKFVSELSGKWHKRDIDFYDLNSRLGLTKHKN